MDIRHGENNKVVLFIFLFEDLKPFLIRLVLLLFPVCIEMDQLLSLPMDRLRIPAHKKLHRFFRLCHTSRSIDVWSDAEGDVFRSDIL